MTACILEVETYEDLINVVACVLEDVASAIVSVRMMLRNKCPWALYVSKATGRRWATFIARAKFKGYHLKYEGDRVICTNLETGKQYRVNLDWCSCLAFKCTKPDELGQKPPCQHIKLLRNLGEKRRDQDAIAHETRLEDDHISINPQECPQGFYLEKIPNLEVPEYEFWATFPTTTGLHHRCMGRIQEKLDGSGILAMTPSSFVGREFSNTQDAIGYLGRESRIGGKRTNGERIPLVLFP
jgi:predicted nucleic acid-binding Zn finger protein